MPRPLILGRKLSRIATKPQNLRKFSPSKVSRYTVNTEHCMLQVKLDIMHLLRYPYFSLLHVRWPVSVLLWSWGWMFSNIAPWQCQTQPLNAVNVLIWKSCVGVEGTPYIDICVCVLNEVTNCVAIFTMLPFVVVSEYSLLYSTSHVCVRAWCLLRVSVFDSQVHLLIFVGTK